MVGVGGAALWLKTKKAAGQTLRVRPSGIAQKPDRQLCLLRPPLDANFLARQWAYFCQSRKRARFLRHGKMQ
jgi:hypothetical protein